MEEKTLLYGGIILTILILGMIAVVPFTIYGFEKTVYNTGEQVRFNVQSKVALPINSISNILALTYIDPNEIQCSKVNTIVTITNADGKQVEKLKLLHTISVNNKFTLDRTIKWTIPSSTTSYGTYVVKTWLTCEELSYKTLTAPVSEFVISETSQNYFGVIKGGAEEWPQPERCSESPCAGWDSTFTQKCYNGDVYYYDCCDTKQQIADDCSAIESCLNAECIEQTEEHSCTFGFIGTKFCSDGNIVQSFNEDDCTQIEKVIEICDFGCLNAECQTSEGGLDPVCMCSGEEIDTHTCADGEVIKYAECDGCNWISTGNICPEEMPSSCSTDTDCSDGDVCLDGNCLSSESEPLTVWDQAKESANGLTTFGKIAIAIVLGVVIYLGYTGYKKYFGGKK